MKSFVLLKTIRPSILLMVTLMFSGLIYAQTATLNESFDKGIKLYEGARFNEAAEAFKHSIKKDPGNAEAWYYLANSYFMMSRDKEAVKAYKRVIELNPHHFLAYNNLGTAYHRLRDFNEAISAYEQALRVKPDSPEAIFGLGVAYLELKDKDAALEQHKRLVAIDVQRADKLYEYITDKNISLPQLNNKAVSLPAPLYPDQARIGQARGTVIIWVSIDETGKVISASAVMGHPLLRGAALQAAKLARFPPTIVNGQPVKTTGLISYDFIPEQPRPN